MIIDMILETPLTPKQIQAMVAEGVGLWTNNRTGQTYVGKRYWFGIPESKRARIRAILMEGSAHA